MFQQPPAFSEIPVRSASENDSNPPLYENDIGNDLWQRWSTSDRANQRIMELQSMLAELEPKLRSKTKEFERSKLKSSKIFGDLRGTPARTQSFIGLDVIKRIRSRSEPDPRETLRQEFELAIKAETTAMRELDTLREMVESSKAQIQHNSLRASESEQLFEILGATAACYILNGSTHIKVIEDDLIPLQASYDKIQTVATDFERARTTVQHAHHYYSATLKKLDDVRAVAFSRGADTTKVKEYQAAAEITTKADICFKETVRVLTSYISTIPEDVLTDFEKLQEMGLLQASKIYTLMYGAKRAASGVSRTLKLLFQTQETVFVSLTRLAIWVQDQIHTVEVELRAARSARDEGRRSLVTAWKTQIDTNSLPNFDGMTYTN